MTSVPLPGLPPGLAARAASRQDVDALVALVASCELANDGVSEVHPSDIAQVFDLARADVEFGGRIERLMVTPIYTAHR